MYIILLKKFKKAGELFERIKDDHRALECYKAGKVYRKGK